MESTPSPQPTMPVVSLSPLSAHLVHNFAHSVVEDGEKKITVNPVVSKFASWYEKLRNAMDYKEEEVVLRTAIERILRRRMLWGSDPAKIASPLVKELVWARYFKNGALPEDSIEKTRQKIAVYLKLRNHLVNNKVLSESTINEWIYNLMSSDIEHMLSIHKDKELIANYMFQILRNQVHIAGEDGQTRDVQVFIAIRRAFARDDVAFLRFHLFSQIFGSLSEHTVDHIASNFKQGYDEIQKQLANKMQDKIYMYVKRRTAVFFILDEILVTQKGKIKDLLQDENAFKTYVFDICNHKYQGISKKVQTAIVRSVVFIIFTKVLFAYLVEGTYERIFFGGVQWGNILINTLIPPILMVIVGLFIRAPGTANSERIYEFIRLVLTSEHPKLGSDLRLTTEQIKTDSTMSTVFSTLWVLAFVISFGAIIYVLSLLGFQWVSMGVFIFFVAVVSFLSYRIALIPQTYAVVDTQGVLTPIVDFLFLPVIRVGRHLTEGISQINIFIFLFDFIIETPFKGIFAFFDQWFLFLHAKREDLG